MKDFGVRTAITKKNAWLCQLASAIIFTLLAAGCTQGPYPLGPGFPAGGPWGNPQMPPGYAAGQDAFSAGQAQIAELQRRVELLDKDNRQLQTQLAQSEQHAQVYRDELGLLRNQLADTVQRLEEERLAAARTAQQFEGLQASTRYRGGATLQANTNARQIGEALKASGFPVNFEADAARVILPADQLFQPGTAQLLPQAARLLTPLASQITRLAPRQRLAVESYCDDGPIPGGVFANPQQMTTAQANAISQLLVQQGGVASQAITVAGNGQLSPRQSNQTAAGRAANRRVEIVIYPDTF
ncbi:OmpA family protein [Planctomycetaceae bacterium SH139]